MNYSSSIFDFLSQHFGKAPQSFQLIPLSGGSVNKTFKVVANNGESYFLKQNQLDSFPELFEKEKQGLEFLSEQSVISIPAVIAFNKTGEEQILLLEWIASGSKTSGFWKNFGRSLAELHHCTYKSFGFFNDNYMGALPQQNSFCEDWNEFFKNYRIHPQIKLALERKFLAPKFIEEIEKVALKFPSIFGNEIPSLLHGDLWSGNFLCNNKNEAVMFDPAIYYGHRSIDLGMTTLFGGFHRQFYDSYHYYFPLPSNYKEQWDLANLYPLLIHLNLFGQSYLAQVQVIIKKFI